MGAALDPAWAAFLHVAGATLAQGRPVLVPADLAPMDRSGFAHGALSEAVGQVENWTLPQKDGSRLHVHVYPSGRRYLHRDRIDPSRGALASARHFLLESRTGTALLMFVGSSAILAGAKAMIDRRLAKEQRS